MHKRKKKNIKTDDAKYLDIVMPSYNLTNTATIIQKYQEVYGKILEMNQL